MMLRFLKIVNNRVTVSRDEQWRFLRSYSRPKQTAGSCNQEGNKVFAISRLPLVKLRWFNV